MKTRISLALALTFLPSLPTVAESLFPYKIVQLTRFEGEDREASASPDGRYIAYLTDPLGTRENQLWLLDLKTGVPRPLVTDLAITSPAAWRPDSSGVVVSAKSGTEGASGDAQLYEVDLASHKPIPVLPHPNPKALMAPAVSPDGKLIAFSRLMDDKSNWDIFLLDRETGLEATIKANSPYREVWPRFSPDGSTLYYFSRAETNGEQDEIYSLRLTASLPIRLTLAPAHDFTPAPSPDGNRIAFISNRLGKPQLFVMMLKTGALMHIDTDGKRAGHPTWSADGKQIFVTLREDGKTGDIYALTVQE